jgi:hypothetical protein
MNSAETFLNFAGYRIKRTHLKIFSGSWFKSFSSAWFLFLTLTVLSRYQWPNRAVSENGLLPFQLCGANVPYLGAGMVNSSFTFKGVNYRIAVTASSAWGIGSKIPRVEFLAYYRTGEGGCPKDSGGHCEIIPRGKPVLNTRISCRIVGSPWRQGFFSILAEKSLKTRYNGVSNVVNIMCPSLELDLSIYYKNHAEICFDQDEKNPVCLSMNICYVQVDSVRRASLCLEPIFGIGSKTKESMAYWKGVTSAWPNGYYGHTLLDSFLKYHVNMLDLHVTVNTFTRDEFFPYLKKYLGPNVAYRPGWDMPSMGGASHYADWEVLAEATCQWEHRLDSQWVIVGYAPDNYIFPRNAGESLNHVLDRIDATMVSGVEIPVMLSHSRNLTDEEKKNVLQRWRVLDLNDQPFLHNRGVTLFNPRHTTHSCIHWNHARTEDFRENVIGLDVIHNFSLSVVHIMAMTRPTWNRIDAVEREILQPWFDELGNILQKELEKDMLVI